MVDDDVVRKEKNVFQSIHLFLSFICKKRHEIQVLVVLGMPIIPLLSAAGRRKKSVAQSEETGEKELCTI